MNLIQMFSYPFMQRALIAGVLVSLCAALLGVSLVLKRYSMIGDGLSHVSFGSLAIAVAACLEKPEQVDTVRQSFLTQLDIIKNGALAAPCRMDA